MSRRLSSNHAWTYSALRAAGVEHDAWSKAWASLEAPDDAAFASAGGGCTACLGKHGRSGRDTGRHCAGWKGDAWRSRIGCVLMYVPLSIYTRLRVGGRRNDTLDVCAGGSAWFALDAQARMGYTIETEIGGTYGPAPCVCLIYSLCCLRAYIRSDPIRSAIQQLVSSQGGRRTAECVGGYLLTTLRYGW